LGAPARDKVTSVRAEGSILTARLQRLDQHLGLLPIEPCRRSAFIGCLRAIQSYVTNSLVETKDRNVSILRSVGFRNDQSSAGPRHASRQVRPTGIHVHEYPIAVSRVEDWLAYGKA
jgi:hypothetical protein